MKKYNAIAIWYKEYHTACKYGASSYQIAIALYFLWGQMGVSSLAGISVILLLIPMTGIQIYIISIWICKNRKLLKKCILIWITKNRKLLKNILYRMKFTITYSFRYQLLFIFCIIITSFLHLFFRLFSSLFLHLFLHFLCFNVGMI